MFSINYLISSKHKNHRALIFNSIVVIAVSLFYQSAYVYSLSFDFLVSPISNFCIAISDKFNSNVIQPFFNENVLLVIGIFKVVLLHFASAISLLYSAQIKAQINEKAKTGVIKRYKYFDAFAILLLLSEIIPLAIIGTYFVI
jgi:hypothetical protein